MSVLGAVPEGLYVKEQDALGPAPLSAQGEVAIEPAPLLVIAIVPVGVVAVTLEVSVTVSVHDVGVFTSTGVGVQSNVVLVVRSRLNNTSIPLPS